MSYDLYIERPGGDLATRIRLLVVNDTPLPEYLKVVHGQWDRNKRQLIRGDFNKQIEYNLKLLRSLGIFPPTPDLQSLSIGSWFIQFTFTLAKPWISRDDKSFYVAESVNPVRKDKIFKIPVMVASSWKGLLRWTSMHIRLASKKDELGDETFAQERFAQTLLFGDEKGDEPGNGRKDFARYVDDLKPEAREHYRRMVRDYYQLNPEDAAPHHRGRLMFYPTFFNLIDVDVINPHSRETKAGTRPIYLECVPEDAKGTFSLLYTPFDLIGYKDWDKDKIKAHASEDLKRIVEAIHAMMLTYGFSAKRTSGYGTTDDVITGSIKTCKKEQKFEHIKFDQLRLEIARVRF